MKLMAINMSNPLLVLFIPTMLLLLMTLISSNTDGL